MSAPYPIGTAVVVQPPSDGAQAALPLGLRRGSLLQYADYKSGEPTAAWVYFGKMAGLYPLSQITLADTDTQQENLCTINF